jgi:hypothetical protein
MPYWSFWTIVGMIGGALAKAVVPGAEENRRRLRERGHSPQVHSDQEQRTQSSHHDPSYPVLQPTSPFDRTIGYPSNWLDSS